MLEIAEDGTLSAVKQTDQNFTTELKAKLEELKGYTAGANISISEDGVISATGGGDGDGGGVKSTICRPKSSEAIDRIPDITFEKVGEVQ